MPTVNGPTASKKVQTPAAPRPRLWAAGALGVLASIGLLALGCGQSDPGAEASAVSSTTTTAPDAADDQDRVGEGDELVDGTHQVTVDSVDTAAGTVRVDAVEVLEGTEAVLAYLADTDGAQLEGPQVYVRDQVERLEELPVDPEGEFAVIFAPNCCEPQDLGWHGFADLAEDHFPDVWGNSPPFEVSIENGRVTSLVQLYVP